MTTEKRTIEILARVKDQATASFRRISSGFKASFGAMEASLKGLRASLSLANTAITGFIGAAVLRTGIQAFQDLAGGLEKVGQSAEQLGVTASSLYLLRNAAAANRIEFDPLLAALRTFKKQAGEARTGATQQAQAFSRLGLSTQQLAANNGDAVESLATIADAFARIEDEGVRTKLALQLFGDGANRLLPMLRSGGAALREWAAAQRAAGLALTDAEIGRAQEYQKALAQLGVTLRAVLEDVVVELAPVLTQAFVDIRKGIENNGPAIRSSLVDLMTVLEGGLQVLVSVSDAVAKSVNGLQLLWTTAKLGFTSLTGTKQEAEDVRRKLSELAVNTEASDRQFNKLSESLRNVRNQIVALSKQPATVPQPDRGDPIPVTAPKPTDWENYWGGFNEGIGKAIARWKDFHAAGLAAGEQIVDSGLNGIADAFADIATGQKKAKDAFRDFARAFLADIARMIAKLVVMKGLQAALGIGSVTIAAEKGAVVPGEIKSVRRFEKGGIARGPTLALFGEGRSRKGEAFVPLPDGRRIPVDLGQNAAGGSMVVNITVQAWDGRDATRALVEQRGTLRALWQRDATRIRAVRQTVRGAAR
jgi:hypothetical protein